MSQLSERILATIERMEEGHGDQDLVDPEEAGIPYFNEMLEFHSEQTMRNMRQAYRRMAGSAPYTSAADAEDRVRPIMLEKMLPVVAAAFADGVQLGQEKSAAYRKYKMYGQLEEIFYADIFREESEMYAVNVLTDEDTCEALRRYMDKTTHQFMHGTGFLTIHGPELDEPDHPDMIRVTNKIWDIWYLSMRSNLIGAYHVGYAMGQRQAEDDVLSGILAASEDGQDG